MAVFRKWKSWEHMLTSWLCSTWAHTLFQLQQTHFWWIRRRSDWRGSSIDFVCRRQSKNWFGPYWRKILERCVFVLRRLQSLVRTRIHAVFHKQRKDIFFGMWGHFASSSPLPKAAGGHGRAFSRADEQSGECVIDVLAEIEVQMCVCVLTLLIRVRGRVHRSAVGGGGVCVCGSTGSGERGTRAHFNLGPSATAASAAVCVMNKTSLWPLSGAYWTVRPCLPLCPSLFLSPPLSHCPSCVHRHLSQFLHCFLLVWNAADPLLMTKVEVKKTQNKTKKASFLLPRAVF